jgi:phosphatidate phosphatase APP1
MWAAETTRSLRGVEIPMKLAGCLGWLLLIAPALALACSARSFQVQPVRPDFVVVVSHRSKAVPGVEVVVTPSPGGSAFFEVLTDENGRAEVRDLPFGEYWVAASYRGIEAGRELIQVSRDAKKPKKQFDFQWADYSYEMLTVRGRLTGLVKGDTGSPLQDLIHPREVVHSGIVIALQNAFSGQEYRAVSDSDGMFVIDPLPIGTYILTISGGARSFGGQTADQTTLVVDLAPSAKRRFLPLRLRDGGCGGAEYELKAEK